MRLSSAAKHGTCTLSARRRNGVKEAGAKTIVIGVLERGGKVHAKVAPNRKKESIEAVVFPSVEKGTTVYTDEFPAYPFAVREYEHKVINHLEKYVDGKIHTNGIENFWSLLKRGLSGTYIAVEPFHLFRYVDEQAFRFNHRISADNKPMKDGERFEIALSHVAWKKTHLQRGHWQGGRNALLILFVLNGESGLDHRAAFVLYDVKK